MPFSQKDQTILLLIYRPVGAPELTIMPFGYTIWSHLFYKMLLLKCGAIKSVGLAGFIILLWTCPSLSILSS
jgi:hypothetical protein